MVFQATGKIGKQTGTESATCRRGQLFAGLEGHDWWFFYDGFTKRRRRKCALAPYRFSSQQFPSEPSDFLNRLDQPVLYSDHKPGAEDLFHFFPLEESDSALIESLQYRTHQSAFNADADTH